MSKLREGLVQRLKPKEKDLVERLRAQIKDQNIEDVLRKFARDNKDTIGEDELLIGISKINANVYIGDIKELIQILKQNGKESRSDGKISIAETVQLIGQ